MSGPSIIAQFSMPLNTSKTTASKNACLLVNINIEAYSVDPDQTVPIEAV